MYFIRNSKYNWTACRLTANLRFSLLYCAVTSEELPLTVLAVFSSSDSVFWFLNSSKHNLRENIKRLKFSFLRPSGTPSAIHARVTEFGHNLL